MNNIKEININKLNPNKIGICLGIIIFILTLLGATYAFVEPMFYNNEVIGFSAIENTDDANKIKITDDKSLMRDFLIPIKEEDIYKAIDRENICVDDKGHYVCSLYEFTIENTWEATQKLNLSLFTENNTYGNYYFMLFKASYNRLSKDNQIVESTHLTQELINKDYTFPKVEPLLEPGQKVTYTILFYVKAIEASQTAADKGKNYTGHINVNSLSTGYSEEDEFKDIKDNSCSSSGMEVPDVSGGLVPIKYDGSKWVVTTTTDSRWYNYCDQKWANAAILKNSEDNVVGEELIIPDGDTITEANSNVYAMFVWVPRYSYTIGCTTSDTCLGYKVEEASALSTTTPGAIDIKFVSKEDKLEIPDMDNGIYPNYTYTNEANRTPTNYYTHPAFWWDKNGDGVRPEDNSEELSGIWVGKFETSVDSTSTCYTSMSESNCAASKEDVTPRILPNVKSLRLQTVNNQFKTAKKFSASGNIYGIDNTKADSHMMKNSEWSAVAYLSQSIYGKYGNKDYSGENKEIYKNDSGSNYTGRSQGLAPTTDSYSSSGTYKYDYEQNGTGASTTGNIYGVYDMSGGVNEYVMGNYQNIVSESGIGSSWFTTTSNKKYYDKFTTTEPFTTKNKQTMGQSLYEVAGWYGDKKGTLDANVAWLERGGYYGNDSSAGAFGGYSYYGLEAHNGGFRSVFVMTIA